MIDAHKIVMSKQNGQYFLFNKASIIFWDLFPIIMVSAKYFKTEF